MRAVERLTGLENVAEWLGEAVALGAIRFELWIKVRGAEQERVHAAVALEPFDIADELLTRVERDRRVEHGHAVYVVVAFRANEAAPMGRAFLYPGARALALAPLSPASSQQDASAYPAVALTTVLATMHQMTQEVFSTLQRENEHQRRNNETIFHASTAHFKTHARSYEKTFEDMQRRLDASLRENAEQRAYVDASRTAVDKITAQYNELMETKITEKAAEERKSELQAFGMRQLGLFAPVLLAKLSRQPINLAAIPAPVAAIVDSLRPEQINIFLNALDPAQQAAVIQVYEMYQEARAKAAASAPAPPAPPVAESTPPTPPEASPSPSAADDAGSPVAPSEATPFTPAEEAEFTRVVLQSRDPRFQRWIAAHAGHVPSPPPTESSGPEGER